jgi:hypothetical protein
MNTGKTHFADDATLEYISKLEAKLADCEQDAAKYMALISYKFENIDICEWNDEYQEYRNFMMPSNTLDEYITKAFKELK